MIKPIDTVYKGYKFRSRLEARWAVFFDTLGIEYDYEPQGFDLDGVKYLPDFWLPHHKIWFEVKGTRPTKEELDKCERLFWEGDYPVVLAAGPIAERKQFYAWVCDCKDSGTGGLIQFFPEGDSYNSGFDGCEWRYCPTCREIDIFLGEYNHRGWFTAGFQNFKICQCDPMNQTGGHISILRAYLAARQARFEFGENGK